MGIMEVSEALRIAGEREVDLVEIAPNSDPRTCKLMDFGKFRYHQSKKNRSQKKPVNKRKEVKLRPKVLIHGDRFPWRRACTNNQARRPEHQTGHGAPHERTG